MFSPYYALARRRGEGDPLNHCAINVALYGEGGKRWTMTERGRAAVERTASSFTVGPSALEWSAGSLTIRFDEIAAPIPMRVRGEVRLSPSALTSAQVILDDAGRHVWRPYAPCARVEVDLERPALSWRGHGYFDFNAGAEPIEDGFAHWTWSRASLRDGAAVLYHARRRSGGDLSLAMRFDSAGAVADFAPPPRVALPGTLFRVARETRAEGPVEVMATLEDAPFYARSMLRTHLLGEQAIAVHESLSLDRFRAPLVQMMLPFRMPRRAGWGAR